MLGLTSFEAYNFVFKITKEEGISKIYLCEEEERPINWG